MNSALIVNNLITLPTLMGGYNSTNDFLHTVKIQTVNRLSLLRCSDRNTRPQSPERALNSSV